MSFRGGAGMQFRGGAGRGEAALVAVREAELAIPMEAKCAHCGKEGEGNKDIKLCGRCKKVSYCSKG